jgi:hypothetical protein
MSLHGFFKGGHAMLRVIKGWLMGTLVVTLGLGAFGCSESTDTSKAPPKGGGGGGMMGEKMKEMAQKHGTKSGEADKDKDKTEDKDVTKDKDKAQDKTKEKDKAKTGEKDK